MSPFRGGGGWYGVLLLLTILIQATAHLAAVVHPLPDADDAAAFDITHIKISEPRGASTAPGKPGGASDSDGDVVARGRQDENSGQEPFSLLTFLLNSYNLPAGDDDFRSHWPKFEFSWRVVVGSAIGFFGAALGSVGGVGGGGIFVPMLILVMGFDSKTATALSKSMIMGGAASTTYFNLKVKQPTADRSVIDYELALLFQPMLLLGISIGIALNVIFADWMIVALLIIIFCALSWSAFVKAIVAWNREDARNQMLLLQESSNQEVEPGDSVRPPARDASSQYDEDVERWWKHVDFRALGLLWLVWLVFLVIQVVKINVPECGATYWVLNLVQVPVAFSVTIRTVIGLYNKGKQKSVKEWGEEDLVEWTVAELASCCVFGISAGVVGGMLGIGGGAILGPLLLEIGISPQVTSATATFVMIFSSSMSVIEYYLLGRIPITYGSYLVVLAIVSAFWCQYFVAKLIRMLKRPSIIVFTLASSIVISAFTMGIVGIIRNVQRFQAGEYMGFESLCTA